ncbi:homeobox protein-like [Planoprotostelium fungivorum]|uniref:Homeobox protein-like n=1 Tax=Planoprotostelium fungivorum TaxID=1890364 RepID=A0A2P6NXN7_9EUKA|nr:homeobox protein-like [Planoprotostelium fungivorum]
MKPSWWQHLEPNIEDGRKKENRTTEQQLAVLNETFKKKQRLTDSETKKLSRDIKMSQRRIQTWFQNQRSKEVRMKKEKHVVPQREVVELDSCDEDLCSISGTETIDKMSVAFLITAMDTTIVLEVANKTPQ